MNKRVYHTSKSLPCTDVSGTANIFQLLISSRGAEVTTIFWSLPQISVQESLSIMTPPARTCPAAHQQHMWWKGLLLYMCIPQGWSCYHTPLCYFLCSSCHVIHAFLCFQRVWETEGVELSKWTCLSVSSVYPFDGSCALNWPWAWG